MSEQEIWQEYDEFSFLAQAKSSYDYVNNANFMKYSNTEMSKDFYRQAVKALSNPHDVVIEAKFILQNLKELFVKLSQLEFVGQHKESIVISESRT